jgi:hypothetical protein
MRRLIAAARRDAVSSIAFAIVVVGALWVVVWPFTRVTHPPITDLPFHAAQVSIFRHYTDPAYHFREQFTLHPFEVPYVTMYGIGILAAYPFSIVTAAKLMAITMLLCLPFGLAVLSWGMGKSPLLGVLGLGFAWTDLTHWGFLNFAGALGLYAAAVGLALALLREPSRRREILLGLTLAAVFFTHVYRFPYAVLAILLAAAVVYPVTRRLRPIARPLGVTTGLFVLWLLLRPKQLSPGFPELHFTATRWTKIPDFLWSSYLGESGRFEHRAAFMMLGALAATVALALAFRDPPDDAATDARRFRRAATAVPLLLAMGHVFAYFVLPARLGEWWYVYPREIVAALFIAVAAVPTIPKTAWVRLGSVSLLVLAASRMSDFVAARWSAFAPIDDEFCSISALLPPAPKLAYLMFDGTGFDKRNSPFVHLPAWVQAERGGWLSFHFAGWGIFPVRYRAGSPAVPPAERRDFEWNPGWFDVTRQGRFFDWFLVRLETEPAHVFARDPSIELVARRGRWWLYRRAQP